MFGLLILTLHQSLNEICRFFGVYEDNSLTGIVGKIVSPWCLLLAKFDQVSFSGKLNTKVWFNGNYLQIVCFRKEKKKKVRYGQTLHTYQILFKICTHVWV